MLGRANEFETIAGVINTVGIHPFISGKIGDPELRRWAYGAYCNHSYKSVVAELPLLFSEEFDQMFSHLPR